MYYNETTWCWPMAKWKLNTESFDKTSHLYVRNTVIRCHNCTRCAVFLRTKSKCLTYNVSGF